jgi:hypothetical protein
MSAILSDVDPAWHPPHSLNLNYVGKIMSSGAALLNITLENTWRCAGNRPSGSPPENKIKK